MRLTWKYVRPHAVGELGSSFGCGSWFWCGIWFQNNSSSLYISSAGSTRRPAFQTRNWMKHNPRIIASLIRHLLLPEFSWSEPFVWLSFQCFLPPLKPPTEVTWDDNNLIFPSNLNQMRYTILYLKPDPPIKFNKNLATFQLYCILSRFGGSLLMVICLISTALCSTVLC